ncbi:MAG: pirin-like C-terminal cupin domain-containing protein [Sediminibacterium sp.]|nr:pirin-like C-terminal cupin domain-containing protein [Sediminibacterium sp.]
MYIHRIIQQISFAQPMDMGGFPILHPLSPVNMFNVRMRKGGSYFIPFSRLHNTFMYVTDGLVQVANAEEIEAFCMAVFNTDGDGIQLNALEDSVVLVGTGEPLKEQVASHGPFVMNNETQIMEAFRDYQSGKNNFYINIQIKNNQSCQRTKSTQHIVKLLSK